MIHIKVKETEPFEKAFKRFTKSCEKAGLIANIKKKQYYEKPSAARKRQLNQAIRKQRKLLRDIELGIVRKPRRR